MEISNIKKCLVAENRKSYDETNERRNIRTRKLSNLYKFRLAIQFLKKRKVRLFLTTILTALTVILLFFSLYICFYNKEEVVLKYMEEKCHAILPLYVSTQYTDDFYVEHDKTLNRGHFLSESVNNILADKTSIGKCLVEQTLSTDEKSIENVTLIFCDNFQQLNLNIEGHIPEKTNEIIVTDYIAGKMGRNIGDIVEYGGCDLTITGIIQTDYMEYNLDRKINLGCAEEFFQFKCEYTYFTIYAKKDLLTESQNKKKYLAIQYSDFLYGTRDTLYFNSYLTIGNVTDISETELLAGHLPENEKEIVVSKEYLEGHSLDINHILENNYYFKDIHSEVYNNYYSDDLNMYNYYKDGVIIVGVIEYEQSDITKDVYVHSDVWNNIIYDNYEYYYANILLLPQQDEYKDIMSVAKESEFLFDEPAINTIINFDKIIKKIKLILLMTLFIVMDINFIMIGTFVSISINENKKNIGVLRSLGVAMSDCMRIFNIEFYAIYLSSILLATFGSVLIINIVNKFFADGLGEVKYDIIKFNIVIYAIVVTVEFLTNFISIKIPMRKMKKQKPIETIRDYE